MDYEQTLSAQVAYCSYYCPISLNADVAPSHQDKINIIEAAR